MTTAITGTIYANELAEDVDYKISHNCVTITSEDGASIFLTHDEVQGLESKCGVFDLEGGEDVITLESDQVAELLAKF